MRYRRFILALLVALLPSIAAAAQPPTSPQKQPLSPETRQAAINLLLKVMGNDPTGIMFDLDRSPRSIRLLGRGRYTDEDLALLKAFPKLRELRLELYEDTPMTETGFAHLAEMSQLRRIDLRCTAGSDTILKYIGQMPAIEALDLTGLSITDTGLQHLSSAQTLTDLKLRQTTITDDGMKHIGKLTHLESLDLSITPLTDEGLAQLLSLPKLRSLNLGGTRVSDEGILKLAKLPELKKLHVTARAVSREGADALRQRRPDMDITGR